MIPCTGDLSLKDDVYTEASAAGYTGATGLKDLHAWPNWFPALPSGDAKLSNFRCRQAYGDFACYLTVSLNVTSGYGGGRSATQEDLVAAETSLALRYTDGSEDVITAEGIWDASNEYYGTTKSFYSFGNLGTFGRLLFKKQTLTKTIDWVELRTLDTDQQGDNQVEGTIQFFKNEPPASSYTVSSTIQNIIPTDPTYVLATDATQDNPTQISGTGTVLSLTGFMSLTRLYKTFVSGT